MANKLRTLLLTSVCGFSLTLTGISRTRVEMMAQRAAPVAVGDTAPDFTLEDQSSRKITLSESREKTPVVLVFYRGYW
jgi:cytochrome oxidase Cu insertion factor (SCO1/SenC/PrrC family)